jgi:hypothetical protein
VDEIVEGTVSLSVGKERFERLEGYREPPGHERIRPD